MADSKKVASLYLSASKSEFNFLAGQLGKVLIKLEDMVHVMDVSHGGGSLSDTYREVSDISRDLRSNVSKVLAQHRKTLEGLARQTRYAASTLKPGQSAETKHLRVHRFTGSVRVTDLTNAGRRGKVVEEFALYDLDAINTNDIVRAKFERWLSSVLGGVDYQGALRGAQEFLKDTSRMDIYQPKVETKKLKGVHVDPSQTVARQLKVQILDTPERTLGVEAKPSDVTFREVRFSVNPETGKRGPYLTDTLLHGPRNKRETLALYNWVIANEALVKKARHLGEIQKMLRAAGIAYDISYLD